MEEIINGIAGYKAVRYLLVLQPHEDLRDKIVKVKRSFYETYKNNSALYGLPHVSIVKFVQYQITEERIVNRLNAIAMGTCPIKIELRDYGSFPSHSIFINVTSKIPVQTLTKKIRTDAQRLMKFDDDNKPHFFLEPHITIARKLKPWQYENAWPDYSQRQFTGRFVADSMLLLSKPLDEFKYKIVKRFEFQNLPVNTKQSALF